MGIRNTLRTFGQFYYSLISHLTCRSSELAVDLSNVCDLQQIVFLLNNLDMHNSRQGELKFTVVTMLNVVLHRGIFDENIDGEIIIDVCRDAISSMTEIVKYGEDDNEIFRAAVILCGTCAGGFRYRCRSYVEPSQRLSISRSILFNERFRLAGSATPISSKKVRTVILWFTRRKTNCWPRSTTRQWR